MYETLSYTMSQWLMDPVFPEPCMYALLHDHRLVIPKSVQERLVNIAHEGHQCIIKTKLLLHTKIWFSGIDALLHKPLVVVYHVKWILLTIVIHPWKCHYYPLGSGWEYLLTWWIYPNGEYLLVGMDDYSQFLVVEMYSITSRTWIMRHLLWSDTFW